jgi:carbamoyl-phosphate synthase large subunit
LTAAQAEGIDLELLSIEDSCPWHAIGAAGLARVTQGPSFKSPDFGAFLETFVVANHVDVVIPSIDPATVAVAGQSARLAELGVTALVSSAELCRCMYDKARAAEFFQQHGIRTPSGTCYPLLAKPRFGASSTGQHVFQDENGFDFWKGRNAVSDFVIQPLVKGTEYSIDAYVAKSGEVLGAISRVRVTVSGGEVMVTRTERNPRVLTEIEKLLRIPGWYGPLVFQAIDSGDGAFLIECNPRFGGGAPCSIEAGLDMPRWIIRERLGRPLPRGPIPWRGGLCMTRSRKDHFLWLSS